MPLAVIVGECKKTRKASFTTKVRERYKSGQVILFDHPCEGQLLLQGTELRYAWSVALDTKTGAMSSTRVNREDMFVLFGS